MKQYLQKLSQGKPLSEEETSAVFELLINSGHNEGRESVDDAQIGAYLFSTSIRPITADELVGGALALRKHMSGLELPMPLLDTAGTGGSGLDSFNTSTATALLLAACGQKVAKHGNRAASSRSGSADVLQALGVKIELSNQEALQCFKETGFVFLFAPLHHPATKRVALIRRSLGFRTIFNYLGPLVNPASAEFQLIGVSNKEILPAMAEALLRLGTTRALLVHGEDGLDEITLTGSTRVYQISDSQISSYMIKPEDFSLASVSFSEISGMEADQAANKIKTIFAGEKSSYRDLICLNAGAALFVCGRSNTILDGIEQAKKVIDSGVALKLLEKLIEVSNRK